MDTNDLSRSELLDLQKSVAKQLADLEKQHRKDAISALHDTAKSFGFTLEELVSGGPKKPTRAAKYRNPETGQEWSGRGRRPAWLVGVDNLSEFEI